MTKSLAGNSLERNRRPGGVVRWMPGLEVLRTYERAWIARDAGAGVALTAILAPAGMGYAMAAGLPAICGLYATIAALLAYALFGPSRVLVLGPDSALAGLIAAAVLPLAAGDTGRAVALAGMLAIISGAMCVLIGLCRFGFVADLLSTPIRYGYLNGIALTVLIGQLPKVFGIPVSAGNLVAEATELMRGIARSQANWTAAAIGASCLVVILLCRRWMPRIPGVLVAMLGATIAASALDLPARTGIAVVGSFPQGSAAFGIPSASWRDVGTLLTDAVAIALVSFGDMSVVSRTFGRRGGYDVDGNREAVALGLANIAAGLFQGFAVSCSASRTPVALTAGARTQLSSVVGAMCLALLLIAAPALPRDLPFAALGAIVIAACFALVEVRGVLRLGRLRRSEFLLSVVCFLGVALLGVIQGVFTAVAIALLLFIWRAWRPHNAVLGRVDGLRGYHDVARHPEARRVPGLVLFRWDAPLFFANAEVFRERVRRAVADAPTPTRWVVVAAEPITDVDLTAADMLAALDREMHEAGIEFAFAEMKGPVKDLLKRYGLFTQLGHESFFLTIGQAVDRYVEANAIPWHD
jgi:high affinity sulfate transporter 1